MGSSGIAGCRTEGKVAVSVGCAVCRCAALEFGGAEWCHKAIERELAHDTYDDDQAKEWWWDARRPLYVQLYRAR